MVYWATAASGSIIDKTSKLFNNRDKYNSEEAMFNFSMRRKTIKELRKNQYLTARDLADKLGLSTVEILNLDDTLFKDVREPLKSRMLPILRGDYMDKIPGL